MHRLIKRLERLEAMIRPAAPNIDDYFDLSKLDDEELRRLIVITEICSTRGDGALSPAQKDDANEMFAKSFRGDRPLDQHADWVNLGRF